MAPQRPEDVPSRPVFREEFDPQFGSADRIFYRRLAGFAGRGFIANIDVAIAHDCYPLLRNFHNAQARGKLHGVRLSWPGCRFGSPCRHPFSGALIRRKPLRSCVRLENARSVWSWFARLNSLGFSRQCFVRQDRRNNCLVSRNHFPFWRRCPETAEGYQVTNETAVTPARNRRLPMRTTSLILAFAFILAGPSMAGSSDNELPGAGTFAYNGSPLANPAHRQILVAAK